MQQFTVGGKLYRIKGNKGIRMSQAEFSLFSFYSNGRLQEQEVKSGELTHVFGDVFITMYPSGVKIRKYFIRDGQVCAGLPKLFLSNDQWAQLMQLIPTIHAMLFGHENFTPCFFDKDSHFDDQDAFVGCSVCVPFLK